MLNNDYFIYFLRHIYNYGIMDGLRTLFDLPYEGTPLRWWGRTEETITDLLDALTAPINKSLYYKNLKELYLSLLNRGASIMYFYILL